MSYRTKLLNRQNAVANAISARALNGAKLDVQWNLTLAANIISANVPYGSIEAIKAVAGVKSVVLEKRYEPCVSSIGGSDPNMATSTAQIGSPAAYAAGYTGAGSRIAIIDTGLDTDHQSFSEGGYLYSLQKNAEKAGMELDEYMESLDLLTGADVAALWDKLNFSVKYKGDVCNTYFSNKVPFGGNYVDKGIDITHDNDSQTEHGSHVAGIAAANSYIYAGGKYELALDAVSTQGVAPDAQLIVMKVFGKNGGAYDSDYMAAIEDAIVLGADSVNLSLGSANAGTSAYADSEEYQAIMDSLVDSGVAVVMSAGNSGAWFDDATYPYLYNDGVNFDTVGSPGSYTNSFTVASVDNDGTTGSYLVFGDIIAFFNEPSGYSNSPISTISGEHEFVYLDSIGTGEEFTAIAELVEGKIAMCNRGTTSFYEKMDAAAAAGAIACIIVNNTDGTINMALDDATSTIPCVSITLADGMLIKEAYDKSESASGDIYTSKVVVSSSIGTVEYDSEYYTMSNFSSWGVPGTLELKPEITAPGGNIYSVNGLIPGGKSYENMSGTSMAAPQIAGMAAVFAQAIKERGLEEKTDLSPRQIINSILMSTATPLVEEGSGSFYSVFKQGAGLANIGEAVNADSYIMMINGANAGAADGKIKAEFGDDPEKEGVYGFGFTINNISDEDKQYTLGADFFTQDVFDDFGDGTYMLDTWTYPLSYGVDWNVDSKSLKASADISNCDFNGDGAVDVNDVQLLLDYDTKSIEIENAQYADVNHDGYVTAYDAYKLLSVLNEGIVTVPAGESVSVWVTIGLSDYQKEIFDEYYPCGAYVEGYVFIGAMADAEGVKGTSHSIPALGFYGNWSDPSMFDVGSYEEYELTGTETRVPYLYAANGMNAFYGNSLIIKRADDPSTPYYFGGNPVVLDEVYMPERNAINNVYDDFSKLNFALIRNASASVLSIEDSEGEVLSSADYGSVEAAFYYANQSMWQLAGRSIPVNGLISEADENEHYTMSFTAVPEYYVQNGEIDFDALGEGTTMSYEFTVDNTAPEIVDITHSLINEDITVTAKDNQYIAALALLTLDGENVIELVGSDADAEPSEEMQLKVPVEELDDGTALLAVYDYAYNYTTYKIVLGGGSTAVESVTFNKDEIEIIRGNTVKLKAKVLPLTADDNLVWTSSDEKVATVNEKGLVTAVEKGECVITATSVSDETKFAQCKVSVVTIPITVSGAIQDEDGNPQLFTWDMENDGTWTGGAALETDIASFAYDRSTDDGAYAYQYNTSGYLYTVDVSDGSTVSASDTAIGVGVPLQDFDFAYGLNEANGTHTALGISGGYILVDEIEANGFTTNWPIGYDYFSIYTPGSTKFVAIAWVGYDPGDEENAPYDTFAALTDGGAVWYLFYDGTENLGLGFDYSDFYVDWPMNSGLQYCSMVMGEDEELYVSRFTGETNELYKLAWDDDEEIYVSTLLGDVGQYVWPCALTAVAFNGEEAEEGTVEPERMFTAEAESFVKPEAAGSLNAAPVSAGIMSKADLADDQSAVTVEVTIKDLDGNDAAANSADLVLAYDTDILKVENVSVNAQFKSVDVQEGYGVISIGLVDEEEIKAGAVAATVTFSVLRDAPTDVMVETATYNEEISDFEDVEDLDVHICPSFRFEDINENDWFHNDVDFVIEEGIMHGISNTIFDPNGNVTRAQMVNVLYNMAGEPDVTGIDNPFTDVLETDWYYEPVLWAADKGITAGVGDGLFAPGLEMNRETMVVFLYNFVKFMGGDMTVSQDANADVFADAADISTWAVKAVVWAVDVGVVNGIETEKGLTFAPKVIATRAQLATVIHNVCG